MVTRISQLRTLKKEFVNPVFDRRCKYGWRAMRSIPAGHRFSIIPSMERDGDGYRHPAFVEYDRFSSSLDRETEQWLMDHSVPTEIKTWADVQSDLTGARLSHSDWLARDVLQLLIERKLLTMDQVRGIAREVLDGEEPPVNDEGEEQQD
jgi:hypothetical protein